MDSQTHIGRALAGAAAMARFDRKGLRNFDFSFEGFWRSFYAVPVTLPIVIAAAAVTPAVIKRLAALDTTGVAGTSAISPGSSTLFLIFETLGFLASWAFFPVAMIWVARMLNLGSRYVPLIVAYNWSRVITSYAVSLPMVLFGLGVINVDLWSLIWFLMLFYLLAYRWFVIRTATEAGGGTAFGLVIFDVVGTLLVQGLIGQIYWWLDPGSVPAPGNT